MHFLGPRSPLVHSMNRRRGGDGWEKLAERGRGSALLAWSWSQASFIFREGTPTKTRSRRMSRSSLWTVTGKAFQNSMGGGMTRSWLTDERG